MSILDTATTIMEGPAGAIISKVVQVALVALVLYGVYHEIEQHGENVVTAQWNAQKLKDAEARGKEIADNQAATRAAQASADNAQTGATTAVKGVYDYYTNHPVIVTRTVAGQRVLVDSNGCATSTPAPDASPAGGAGQGPADDGHPAAGDTRQVQEIEPNLLPRCAETTVMFLECRNLYNQVRNSINQ